MNVKSSSMLANETWLLESLINIEYTLNFAWFTERSAHWKLMYPGQTRVGDLETLKQWPDMFILGAFFSGRFRLRGGEKPQKLKCRAHINFECRFLLGPSSSISSTCCHSRNFHRRFNWFATWVGNIRSVLSVIDNVNHSDAHKQSRRITQIQGRQRIAIEAHCNLRSVYTSY